MARQKNTASPANVRILPRGVKAQIVRPPAPGAGRSGVWQDWKMPKNCQLRAFPPVLDFSKAPRHRRIPGRTPRRGENSRRETDASPACASHHVADREGIFRDARASLERLRLLGASRQNVLTEVGRCRGGFPTGESGLGDAWLNSRRTEIWLLLSTMMPAWVAKLALRPAPTPLK